MHTFAVAQNMKDRQNTKQEHLYKHKQSYKKFYHQKIHPGGKIQRWKWFTFQTIALRFSVRREGMRNFSSSSCSSSAPPFESSDTGP
jgi:hypothetical protein